MNGQSWQAQFTVTPRPVPLKLGEDCMLQVVKQTHPASVKGDLFHPAMLRYMMKKIIYGVLFHSLTYHLVILELWRLRITFTLYLETLPLTVGSELVLRRFIMSTLKIGSQFLRMIQMQCLFTCL